ncbi:MAG: ATP-binding cassette domain-containing protein [Bacteroidetes bacterium]|nr:ATP-binding cassette domain-containing protein [Bacteroidota bacterium]
MIQLQNLSMSYSGKTVLTSINQDFELHRIYGIVGLNGAGKSTLFNVLSAAVKAQEGQILFNGKPLHYKDIAYLETVNYFYSRITGNEYLTIFKQSNPEFNLVSLQEYFKLPLDELIETYSTGMRKKLALLGILKQDKSIYLFDEPFNGLDMETNKVLEIIIQTLKQKGKTIFISSHIIDPLLHLCDSIHYLEHGIFTKNYSKENFHKIEEELFSRLKREAQVIISKSI